jgi:hypothetical protein
VAPSSNQARNLAPQAGNAGSNPAGATTPIVLGQVMQKLAGLGHPALKPQWEWWDANERKRLLIAFGAWPESKCDYIETETRWESFRRVFKGTRRRRGVA